MRLYELFLTESPLNEIEIGGGVDGDYLNALQTKDYSNKQLDLFKEIPTTDPHLPPDMKVVGRLGKFYIVQKKISEGDEIILFDVFTPIAITDVCKMEREHDISHFLENGVGRQIKAIYIDPDYRGSNLGLAIYEWVLTNMCDYLVADQLQTQEGVRLWKKLQNSKRFHVEVFNRDTYDSRRRWPGKDFNRVYDRDGVLIPWVTIPSKLSKVLDHD